jgi:hypothetical protein
MSRSITSLFLFLLTTIAFFRPEAAAQKVRKECQNIIPDAPAYTFLGIAPAAISRPTTPRALGTAVINGIDADGDVNQGLALDIAPWVFIPNMRITLKDYQQPGLNWKYMLANTQVSLATSKTADDNTTNLAYGLRVVLFDASDPMRNSDFTTRLNANVNKNCGDRSQPGQIDATAACVEQELIKMRQEWANTTWNKAGLSIAAAGGWRYNEGFLNSAHRLGRSVWATGALPVGKFAQVVGQVKYDWVHGAGEDPNLNRLSYGARFFGGSGNFNFYLEYAGVRNTKLPENLTDRNSRIWSGGVEFKVADKFWLATGLGKGFEIEGKPEKTYLLANLRWDVTQDPALKGGE